ncbi:MAG: hypothetical protein EU549_01170 [Promethearchaeota archaeon]|nr:MAG: hypothetical protein EU549_01170 [Candidatus Lokiarchaeota archaeon]
MKKKIQFYIILTFLLSAFLTFIFVNNGSLIPGEGEPSVRSSNGGYGIYWVEAGQGGDGTSETSPAGNITYILDTYDIEDKIINVKEGTYDTSIETFPLLLDKENVTIQAVGRREYTIIDSNGGGHTYGEGDQYKGFLIENSSVSVSGFQIEDCSTAFHLHGISSSNALKNLVIANNSMIDNSYGVYSQNINKSVIKDNIFGDTIIQWGIRFVGGYDCVIHNNNITESDFVAIFVSNGGNNTISYNNVSKNPEIGIMIDSSIDNVLKNNIINDNGAEAIHLQANSNNNTISNNEIDGNGAAQPIQAIYLSSSHKNIILSNNITNTVDEGGVYLSQAHNNTFILNNISANNEHGIHIFNSNQNNVTLNLIKDNGGASYNEIYLQSSDENIVDRNIIETNDNQYNVELEDSNNNTILRNNLTNTQTSVPTSYEIRMNSNCEDNLVYKNNIYSTCNAPSSKGNEFNSSIIGNYWKVYSGSDSDGDKIGDTQYLVSSLVYDFLPAMQPIDIMDTTDPTISITDPSDDDVVCTNFTVQWDSNDNGEIYFYSIHLKNYGWNYITNTQFSYTNILNGSYTIQTRVTDKGWNIAMDTISVVVDNTTDLVIITSPMAQDYDYNLIDINVSIQNVHTPVDTVLAYLNGGPAIELTHASGSMWSYDAYYFPDSALHTIDIVANDTCGNVNDTESVSFKVDSTNPEVSIDTPNNNTYYTSLIDINTTVTDETSTVATVKVEIDGTQNVTLTDKIGNLFYLLDREFQDGLHSVRIFAYDTVGNVNSSENVFFTVDTDTINITLNNPQSTNYTSLSVMINATVECESVLDTVLAEVNGLQNVTLTQNGAYWTKTHLFSEGSNTIRIYVNDTFGNEESTSVVSFNIDSLAPVWDPVPINHTITVGDGISYTYNANDVSGVAYSLNETGTFIINSATGVLTNDTELSVGVYWVEIIAEDPFGHSISAVVKVTVESAPVPSTPPGNVPGFPIVLLYAMTGVSALVLIAFKKKRVQ